MTNKPKNCPQHCERRSATCHAECKDYLLYREWIKRVNEINNIGREPDQRGYAIESKMRHMQRKKNHKE